ncbi:MULTISPECIES: TadE/TadG family type IV pilus assembly protein [unclassified Nocardioides]|uniref:TadE/TadG family type IV pilus assembly protein n=1 Tax=unclassified Nocardioides TaxID=2615069 RepID=UPI0009F02906|nr:MULTISPECIES: TadE/TadG family type IV pilus assembly protein [unclassified Nocardioides]GAW48616.1 TadE family protein (Precursor) [Nocardioides sp. PD653-B2]GAW54285.1 TadE family protein (Precursor) [Nocardioides sp. PD653]
MSGGVARPARRGERGAAAVEFALVVPFLLLLVFGIISYGFMLSFRQGVSQGAAEGARAAAVSPAGDDADRLAAARDALNDSLDTYGVTCDASGVLLRGGTSVGTCAVTIAACANDGGAQCASLTVDYLYDDHPLVPGFPLVPLPDHLDYTAVARVS